MDPLQVAYATFKQASAGLHVYWLAPSPDTRVLWSAFQGAVFTCSLDDAADVADFDAGRHAPLEVPAAADGIVLALASCRLPLASDGRERVSAEKSTQSRVTLYSHDWTAPSTWYSNAAFVQNEAAVDSGDHTTYQLAHQNVIDTFHGRITAEDYLVDAQGRSFRVVVQVSGVTRHEQDPHTGTGGDFVIDYAAGSVRFLTPLAPTDVVAVTYHYATDSTFVIRPAAGKNLRIDWAEVQFALDVQITDSVVFQPYGLVDAFAPQLVAGGQVPSGTKIPLGPPLVYKTILDYQNDAVKAYPSYPALGGAGWRGLQQGCVVMDWDYQASTLLIGAAGMEIHLKLQHDTPFGGSYATATFYCLSENP